MPARKLNLKGLRFGRLIVLREGPGVNYETKNYRETTWICICDCGKETNVRTKCLRKLATSSCGCQQNNAIRFLNDEASLRELFRDYKSGAKQRDLEFDLNIDDFRSITSTNCQYCGIKPSKYARARKGTKLPYIYNGIDRYDNKLGYTKDNCVPCCATCNHMKCEMTVIDFTKHINRVANHLYRVSDLAVAG